MAFQRVTLIYNPAARRVGRNPGAIAQLTTSLAATGIAVTAHASQAPGNATELAAAARAQGADLVVVYGGDGTVNEALQALVASPVSLGIWPGGTANVLAYDLRMPSSPAAIARRILAGRTMLATCGLASAPDGGQRYFLAMAGIGFDASVVLAVRPGMKSRLGKSAFALEVLHHAFTWRPVPFRLRWQGSAGAAEGETTAAFAVLGNTPSYGGGLRLTPTASLTRPGLELCAFDGSRLIDLLRHVPMAPFGLHPGQPGVTYVTTQSMEATPASGAVPVQLDGETFGMLPLHFTSVPDAVRLLI